MLQLLSMKMKVREKQLAIRLRRLGQSYSEILAKVPVSKATLSGWLRHLNLTDKEEKFLRSRINNAQDRGRLKVALGNRARRIERDKVIEESSLSQFRNNIKDPFFAFGVVMYWAEGSKKNRDFRFINSDPVIIKLMLEWIKRFLGPGPQEIKVRLYTHRLAQFEGGEAFWSRLTGIDKGSFMKTIYKETPHKVKRNSEYKGCLSISLGKVNYYVTLMTWQSAIAGYYDSLMRP